ncbi:O-antigen ligase family protein [filamentous cyanobacterium LEGE 11480]|uniref:O-antigen ligase family protein n=1 Tax=Romeriopsis navalis LEGE 11480 TaxID=2777977 RepID=A0A928VI83_9CYAN|nr:O-antigen ligase family protein [Romeriopsis navalis]MBE9028800.1 O-antigen ligase family protein [Romeriopsis navalis LEGE 11480]
MLNQTDHATDSAMLNRMDIKRILSVIEIWVAGFYFAYFLGFNFPQPVTTALNLTSYPVLAILVVSCWKRVLHAASRDWAILLLHFIAFISILWSAAPEVTTIESKTFVRAALFGFYLAVRFGLKGQMRLLSYIFGAGILFSVFASLGFPSYGVTQTGEAAGSWKGIYIFKNLFASTSSLAAILFLLLALEYRKQRWLNIGLLILSLVSLGFSQGRTAAAALLIVLCLLPFRHLFQQAYRQRVVIGAAAVFVSLTVIGIVLGNLEFILVDVLGKNLEFNGRVPIWELMVEFGSQRPWLGHGIGGFWTSEASDYLLTFTWASATRLAGVRFNAHNGYIDLFLQLGVVGLALFGISFVTLLWRTVYVFIRTQAIEIFWVLQTLLFLTIVSLADSLSVGTASGQWILYVSFTSAIAIEYQRLTKRPAAARSAPWRIGITDADHPQRR